MRTFIGALTVLAVAGAAACPAGATTSDRVATGRGPTAPTVLVQHRGGLTLTTAPQLRQVRATAPTRVANQVEHAARNVAGSTDWSGYAETGPGFTAISGNWTVPAVASANPTQYSSEWVGIDGDGNSNLIQTGTSMDSNGTYYPWWEILPAYETRILSPVSPGDAMSASIVEQSAGNWDVVLTDQTAGWQYNAVHAYSGPGTSAEWILEAPTIGGSQSTLANYGTSGFSSAALGTAPANLSYNADAIVMVDSSGNPISMPSTADSAADAFNLAYGSSTPPPPPDGTTTTVATTTTVPVTAGGSTPTTIGAEAPPPTTAPASPVIRRVPSAPRALQVHTGRRSVSVSWLAPAATSGVAVRSYLLRVYRAGRLEATFRLPGRYFSAQIRGLRTRTAYRFSVSAVTAYGAGPARTSPRLRLP